MNKSIFNVETNEEWRDVKGYEGYYQVSNSGRVKSLSRIKCNGAPLTGKLIAITGDVYKSVNLWRDGVSANKLVHRLVAEAFIPNPDNLPEVNHKDKNISNNCLSNLEWVSVTDNNVHKQANRTKSPYRRSVICLESGQIFKSISEAGRSVSTDATRIIESIQHGSSCKGLTFVYADQMPQDIDQYLKIAHERYEDYHPRPNMKNSRKVIAIETNEQFDSIAAAARFFNCDTATINNRIKAAKSFNGITLQFLDE